MKENEYEQLDALMRVLFREGEQAWYHVYTKANIPKAEADWLYKTLKADGFVEVRHKGADFSIPDPHYVDLTDVGRSWFSHNSYVKKYLDQPNKQNIGQSIYINNSNVTDFKAQSGSGNQINNDLEKSKSFWKNEWVVGIGVGIVILLFGLALKHFFGIS